MTMANERIKITFNASDGDDERHKLGFWPAYLLVKDERDGRKGK